MMMKCFFHSSSEKGDGDLLSGSGLGDHSDWLHGLDSPLIKGEGGGQQKELKLRYGV